MDHQKQAPLFVLRTRSFWLAAGAMGTFLAQDTDMLHALITALGAILPFDGEAVADWAVSMAPLVLFLAAMQQRSGAARPYSMNPQDT